MYRYFPHAVIRDEQKVMIPNVHKIIHSDEYDGMIYSAANGTGKTACMTSQALLALEEGLYNRVIFAIPVDATKENYLKELNVKHDKKVKKVISKEILCNWMKEKEDERISAIEEEGCAFYLCKLQGHKCRYKGHGCLYELQKEEIKTTDILICDYNYIISPFIRKFSGFEDILNNNRTLLFIDECHMLKKRAEMIYSNSISTTTINRCLTELENYGHSKEKMFVKYFLSSIEIKVNKNYKILKSGMEKNYEGIGDLVIQHSDILNFFGTNNLEDIKIIGEILISVGESISNIKFEKREGLISYTEVIGNFMLRFVKLVNFNKNSAVFFLKLKNKLKKSKVEPNIEDIEIAYVGWSPLDVRGFLRNAIKKADKYILYSGTISSWLRNDIGLEFEKIYMPTPIVSPYLFNRIDIILPTERFYLNNLKDESFTKRVTNNLDELLKNIPRPIGIICTNLVCENLNLLSKYNILNEPETQEETGDWLKNKLPNAEIIRYTAHGRLGQSVDMSYLKSIIVLGIPYEKYDSIMEEKIDKTAKSLKGKAGNRTSKAVFIKMIKPALEKTVQSVMRGLRNENDKIYAIYYDVNFKYIKPALGSKNLVICNTINEVINHIHNN